MRSWSGAAPAGLRRRRELSAARCIDTPCRFLRLRKVVSPIDLDECDFEFSTQSGRAATKTKRQDNFMAKLLKETSSARLFLKLWLEIILP
jgi:hypothetical protein